MRMRPTRTCRHARAYRFRAAARAQARATRSAGHRPLNSVRRGSVDVTDGLHVEPQRHHGHRLESLGVLTPPASPASPPLREPRSGVRQTARPPSQALSPRRPREPLLPPRSFDLGQGVEMLATLDEAPAERDAKCYFGALCSCASAPMRPPGLQMQMPQMYPPPMAGGPVRAACAGAEARPKWARLAFRDSGARLNDSADCRSPAIARHERRAPGHVGPPHGTRF